MTHVKTYTENRNGKLITVPEHDDKRAPAKQAFTHQRVAMGQHKDGTHYLRAGNRLDAKTIHRAAGELGIKTEHRKERANHNGVKGVYHHFHTKDPRHAEAIYNHLHKQAQAKESKATFGDHEKAKQAYADQGDATLDGRKIDVDEARELVGTYKENRTIGAAVIHDDTSKFAKRLFKERLAMPLQSDEETVLFTAGGGGSGKGTASKKFQLEDAAHTIWDGAMSDFEKSKDMIEEALASGRTANIVFIYRPVEKAVEGMVGRAHGSGRVVPLHVLAHAHKGALESTQKLLKHYADSNRVNIMVVDNSGDSLEECKLIPERDAEKFLEERAYDEGIGKRVKKAYLHIRENGYDHRGERKPVKREIRESLDPSLKGLHPGKQGGLQESDHGDSDGQPDEGGNHLRRAEELDPDEHKERQPKSRRFVQKAHVKGHIRVIDGHVVWVHDHETKRTGRVAKLHERTALGQHKTGTHYLRASDADDAATVERTIHRVFPTGRTAAGRPVYAKVKDKANHHGEAGKFTHFHFHTAEDAAKVLAELANAQEAPEEVQGDLLGMMGEDLAPQAAPKAEPEAPKAGDRNEEEPAPVKGSLATGGDPEQIGEPEREELRALMGLDKAKLDAYDPKEAVYKSGRQWNYNTVGGNAGGGPYDTKREATAAATAHHELLTKEYAEPESYWDLTSARARKWLQIHKTYENKGMTELQAAAPTNQDMDAFFATFNPKPVEKMNLAEYRHAVMFHRAGSEAERKAADQVGFTRRNMPDNLGYALAHFNSLTKDRREGALTIAMAKNQTMDGFPQRLAGERWTPDEIQALLALSEVGPRTATIHTPEELAVVKRLAELAKRDHNIPYKIGRPTGTEHFNGGDPDSFKVGVELADWGSYQRRKAIGKLKDGELPPNQPEPAEEAPAAATEGPKDGDRNEDGLVFHNGRWHREEEPAQTPAPAGEQITKDNLASLSRGDKFTDSQGNVFQFWDARANTITAHPVVDGMAQVNATDRVLFWINHGTTPPGDSYRADPVFIRPKREDRWNSNQAEDTRPGHYYVSARDGAKHWLLAGPYETHAQALDQVKAVKAYAENTDPKAIWMSWGTARREPDAEPKKTPLGRFGVDGPGGGAPAPDAETVGETSETAAHQATEEHSAAIETPAAISPDNGQNPTVAGEPLTFETQHEVASRIRKGEITPEDLMAEWERFKRDRPALQAELEGQSKAKMIQRLQGLFRIDPKTKATQKEIVKGVLRSMGDGYHVLGSFSWSPFTETHDQAMDRVIQATTAEQIADYAARVTKAREDRIAQNQAVKKAIENPETLEEFETRARYKAPELTADQRRRWEELKADAQRAAVAPKAAYVQAVSLGDVAMELHETKHTKTGEDLHVVTLSQRVDRDLYNTLNERAKKLGGWYSSYRGNGAIPGFTFKNPESAKAFMATEQGQVAEPPRAAEEVQAERQAKVSSKLRDMAEGMIEKADAVLNAERRTNTHRQADQAAHTRGQAEGQKALAQTMLNLSDAIEDGRAKHLGGLKNRAQIETLDSVLQTAKVDRDRADEKVTGKRVQWEESRARPANIEDTDHAAYPYPTLWSDHFPSMIADLEKCPQPSRVINALRKLQPRGEVPVKFDTPAKVEVFAAMVEKLGQSAAMKYRAQDMKERLAPFARLQSAGIETPEQLRAALREFLVYKTMAKGEDPIKAAERSLVGAKFPGYFPTPNTLAQEVVDKANIAPGMKILEPSAGKGNLIDAIHQAHGKDLEVEAIEPINALRTILEAKGHNIVGRDILEHNPGEVYDRVVMNPPFENGQDMEHVRHAFELLKPGGRLVAITSPAPYFHSTKKAQAFREWLDELGAVYEPNPEGSFKESGTGVNTYTLTIDKPQSQETAA